eukprot:TRINITY_DN12644_c0_g2_i1.p1 TRINITY_DN12644_c0_g2~~TRINITY_DN12644_c0_g2_i1.p1  ORF type:complete len:627 (+),score=61.11 TRINITY_DN12644_c0_g2_i1:102-1883(+)
MLHFRHQKRGLAPVPTRKQDCAAGGSTVNAYGPVKANFQPPVAPVHSLPEMGTSVTGRVVLRQEPFGRTTGQEIYRGELGVSRRAGAKSADRLRRTDSVHRELRDAAECQATPHENGPVWTCSSPWERPPLPPRPSPSASMRATPQRGGSRSRMACTTQKHDRRAVSVRGMPQAAARLSQPLAQVAGVHPPPRSSSGARAPDRRGGRRPAHGAPQAPAPGGEQQRRGALQRLAGLGRRCAEIARAGAPWQRQRQREPAGPGRVLRQDAPTAAPLPPLPCPPAPSPQHPVRRQSPPQGTQSSAPPPRPGPTALRAPPGRPVSPAAASAVSPGSAESAAVREPFRRERSASARGRACHPAPRSPPPTRLPLRSPAGRAPLSPLSESMVLSPDRASDLDPYNTPAPGSASAPLRAASAPDRGPVGGGSARRGHSAGVVQRALFSPRQHDVPGGSCARPQPPVSPRHWSAIDYASTVSCPSTPAAADSALWDTPNLPYGAHQGDEKPRGGAEYGSSAPPPPGADSQSPQYASTLEPSAGGTGPSPSGSPAEPSPGHDSIAPPPPLPHCSPCRQSPFAPGAAVMPPKKQNKNACCIIC